MDIFFTTELTRISDGVLLLLFSFLLYSNGEDKGDISSVQYCVQDVYNVTVQMKLKLYQFQFILFS